MALINIDTALTDAIRLIARSPVAGGLEILSYKRNRTVAIIRLSETSVCLREQGYVAEETVLDFARLNKRLKLAIKREFPRSRKVRFYLFSSPEELVRIRQII